MALLYRLLAAKWGPLHKHSSRHSDDDDDDDGDKD